MEYKISKQLGLDFDTSRVRSVERQDCLRLP